MLWYILYVVIGIATLVVMAFAGLLINAHLGAARTAKRLTAALSPVREALREERTPDGSTIEKLAADPMTRSGLFELLREHSQLNLFPREYASREAFAESDLVYWLTHPNELNAVPNEIELVTKINLDSGTEAGVLRWYLFKFRTHGPHWAAHKGWMAGVGGPYPEGYIGPIELPLLRSEMLPLSAMPIEQHVRMFHDKAESSGVFEHVAKLRRAPKVAM